MAKKTLKRYGTNAIDPASTTSKDFGFDICRKGGDTQNASIDPHAFEREQKLIAKDDYVPEHERYLGQTVVMK